MASEPSMQPPEPPDEHAPAATAGLGIRLVARLLDGLLVFIPASIVLAIVGLPAPTMGLGGLSAWTHSLVTSLLWFGYYVALESGSGQTVGKRLVNIRVVGSQGGTPTVSEAATRNVWTLFGLVPIVGGLAQLVAVIVIAVTIGSSPQHRGKHDEFAGTTVMS